MEKANVVVIRPSMLEGIVNKNEARVRKLLPEVVEEFAEYRPTTLEIQDIYALSLNLLPPRYVQQYSFVISEPIAEARIREALREAVETVRAHPKG